jgi:HlyD family secretion protein
MDARRLLTAFTLTGLSFGILSGCSTKEKEPEPVVSVQAVEVKKGEIEQVVRAEAVLFPVEQAAITAKINAPVKKFYVNRGAKVKTGQLLATLENSDLTAAATENEGSLKQAEAAYAATTTSGLPEEMRKAELDAESSKQALDAQQKLFESRENLFKQGALPRKDLDQARVSLTQARSQYEVAQKHWDALQAVGREQELKAASGQLQSARGKYVGAQAQLSYSEIRSPINGVVAERALYPGEMATAGSPLIVVVNTSAIIAKAHIPQQEASLLKVGDKAELSVPGIDGPTPARITVISPATDPGSTTIEVWAQAENKGNKLRPGTSAQMEISAAKVPDALIVPSSALLNGADGATNVMVLGSDSHAHLQAVQIGIRTGDRVQIKSGVQARQKVINTGAYGLPDNTKVQVEAAPPAEQPDAQPAKSEKDSGSSKPASN